jgi:hypothetical protein
VYEAMTYKVLHSRFNVFLTGWKERHCSRFSQRKEKGLKSNLTLREELKVAAQGSKKKPAIVVVVVVGCPRQFFGFSKIIFKAHTPTTNRLTKLNP